MQDNNNNMPALSNSWFVLFGCACQKCVTLMSATSCRHEISGKLPETRPQFGLLEALTSRQSFLGQSVVVQDYTCCESTRD